MLYYLTALKCEASALRGLPGEVIITGAGKRASASIPELKFAPEDIVINVGICAGTEKGKGFLVNQVISEDTGKRYYPDILFESGIPEMPLTTSSGIVTQVKEGMLYDMEASVICGNVLKVIPPSNLVIYKVVSDSGSGFPDAGEVTRLIRSHAEEIKKITGYMTAGAEKKEYGFLPDDTADELRLTQYMRNELKDIEHYCAVAGRKDELTGLLDDMRRNGRIPVKDKKAGREVLDEIYAHLR